MSKEVNTTSKPMCHSRFFSAAASKERCLWQLAARLIQATQPHLAMTEYKNTFLPLVTRVKTLFRQRNAVENKTLTLQVLTELFFLNGYLSLCEIEKLKTGLTPHTTITQPQEMNHLPRGIVSFPRFPGESQEENNATPALKRLKNYLWPNLATQTGAVEQLYWQVYGTITHYQKLLTATRTLTLAQLQAGITTIQQHYQQSELHKYYSARGWLWKLFARLAHQFKSKVPIKVQQQAKRWARLLPVTGMPSSPRKR